MTEDDNLIVTLVYNNFLQKGYLEEKLIKSRKGYEESNKKTGIKFSSDNDNDTNVYLSHFFSFLFLWMLKVDFGEKSRQAEQQLRKVIQQSLFLFAT